jgi:hypothetical protein
MPAAGRLAARRSALKCGHFRDIGNRRTSRTRSIPCAFRISSSLSIEWLECPTVQTRFK